MSQNSYCSFQNSECNKALDQQEEMKIFLSYPSDAKIKGYMKDLVGQKQLNGLTIFPWEKLSDTGGIIFCKICNAISSSSIIVADITYLNQNVLFELGFGMAIRKIPVLIREENREGKIIDILQDIKRIDYTSIPALAGKLYSVCKDSCNFDPLKSAKIDPPWVKKYPVWKERKNSKQEGGNDGCQTDKSCEDVKAGRASDKRDMPQDRYISKYST